MARLLRRWYGRRTWGRLLYAVLGVPLAVIGFVSALVVLVPGVLLSLTPIGLPWLAVGLRGARDLAALHRELSRRLLGEPLEPPPAVVRGRGIVDWVRAGLTDAAGWRALAYLIGKSPVALVLGAAAALTWAYGIAFASYPVWSRFVVFPSETDEHGTHLVTPTFGDWSMPEWLYVPTVGVVGLLLLLAAPWITRGLLWPERLLARTLLRPTRADTLRQAHAQAMDDSAARLRRIERDLHDGAQAQLVTLALELGLAKDELAEGDPAAALALVDTAHQGAKQALVELRDLVRGIHPPVLDTGLGPALQTLSARSPVPVELDVQLPDRPSPAIETIAYFTAAELLVNVAKHSRARAAALSLTAVRPGWLRLTVRDDGTGGARRTPAGGLAGLTHRVGTVDGTLELVSPPGGPTVVTVELPVRA
ncbi:sensor histidine kinase [Cryptosporangium aurantiacum]|uniref:sensor histidine kinase n=1 Tax=Cryptosporangium aurantiacum TaxID=134849 RepID=UPI0009337793|nr:sensor histidine kinase [Cryptosporangium aurantiacum]